MGEKSRLKFHSDLYGFGIQYTFFENIEDERTGCRPNDVYFSLMIFAKDHHIKIEQSISGVEVYDFPDIEYLYSENQDDSHFFNFNETEEILFQAIQDFLNNRIVIFSFFFRKASFVFPATDEHIHSYGVFALA